jgi:hypothetical protein
MSTTTDKMARNAQKYRERLGEIRRDWTLSEAAKRQEIQAAFEEARTTHARLAQEYRAGVRERLEGSRKAAFAPPKIAGSDNAMALMAYRDALDRASRTTDGRALSELLSRAEMTGDHPLARAVLYRGYELQSEGLVRSYFQKYPEELPAWEEFMGAAEEHNTLETLGITAAAGVPEPERPQELGRQFAATSRGVPGGEEV